MKTNWMPAAALLLAGCSPVVPIADLALPPVSVIEGQVTQLDQHGFRLKDDSGSIAVKAELPDSRPLPLAQNEQVRVYGNLRGGRERVFDGYVIRRQSGAQIMISRPQPHFGLVMQTSFAEQ